MLSSGENLSHVSMAPIARWGMELHTLSHPGNSQAWTRLPFFALLTRRVVGVYVIASGSEGPYERCMVAERSREDPPWGPKDSDRELERRRNGFLCAADDWAGGLAARPEWRRRCLGEDGGSSVVTEWTDGVVLSWRAFPRSSGDCLGALVRSSMMKLPGCYISRNGVDGGGTGLEIQPDGETAGFGTNNLPPENLKRWKLSKTRDDQSLQPL